MQWKEIITTVKMDIARKNTRRRGWSARHQPAAVVCEPLEDKTLLSALGDGAYELLHQRVAENLGGFYVYKDAGSAFNHGELTLYSSQSPSPVTLVSVDADCISDPTSPDGCATDPETMDRIRGTVLHIHVDPLSAGQFAGIAIRGTANVPTGINLTGATNLVFEARTSGAVSQSLNIDIGGAKVTRTIPTGSAFTTISIPLTSLAGGSVNLAHQDLLFAAGFSSVQARNGVEVFLDNIRFEPVPMRQQTQPTLPLSYQTFAVIPETRETIGGEHPIYPLDQVVVNTSTIYEASMTAISLLQRGQPQDLIDGRRIADAFVYALGHDLRRADGTPDPAEIQPIGDGSRGLHDAYQGGDLAAGPGSLAGGEVRMAGFSVGANLEHYYLVLDGASGGNNSFAMFALLKAYQTFNDVTYLNAARGIGRWIVGALKDTSPLSDSFGGYFIGYDSGGAPNNGNSPRVLNRGKSIENNADIFAAFSQLASIEKGLGRLADAAYWTTNANHAGDFVMDVHLYDAVTGRFYAGTAPVGTPPSEGIDPSGASRTNESINVYDFLDAQSFVTLALSASARYRDAIDWRRPVQHMLTAYDQTVMANGQQFQGFSLTTAPTHSFPRQPSANGIAWEFTGQVVATMQFVDALYGETGFASQIQFYSNELRRAQMLAPYGDGKGLVAATLDGENESNSPFLPVDQALTTPFQAIPERVALAATNWAIYVDLAHNFFIPQSSLPVITGPETPTPLQRPQVTWTPVSGAVSYDVWIRNQSTNVSPVILTTVSGTSYVPGVDMGIGKFNVWVRSTNAVDKKSAWSLPHNFQINTAVTLQPLDRQQNTARPTIRWAPLPGAVRYELWIDNLTAGQRPYVHETNITGTSWTSPTDMPLSAYRAWVRGIDAAGVPAAWSSLQEFQVMPSPVLTSPVNPTFDRRPVFSWNPVTGALTYEIFIRNQTTGATTWYQKGIAGTSWTPPVPLADGPYQWWVLAVGVNGVRSFWSDPASTYIGGRTDLLTPTGTVSDSTPTFSWRPVEGAASYRLWVNRTDVFVGQIIDVSGLTSTSYTPTTALPVGTYRAWVQAISSTGQASLWSIPVNFTITSLSQQSGSPSLDSLLVDMAMTEFALAHFITEKF